jgi:hypothetical protein
MPLDAPRCPQSQQNPLYVSLPYKYIPQSTREPMHPHQSTNFKTTQTSVGHRFWTKCMPINFDRLQMDLNLNQILLNLLELAIQSAFDKSFRSISFNFGHNGTDSAQFMDMKTIYFIKFDVSFQF